MTRAGPDLPDLNLPTRGGREVLGEIEADPDRMTIPVVALTTLKADGDVARTCGSHANGFIPKPMGSPTSARRCAS